MGQMILEDQVKELSPPTSAEAVLRIILKSYDSGCTSEEIAIRILSGGMDATVFRVKGLVEIAIAFATHRKLESERVPDGETPSDQGD